MATTTLDPTRYAKHSIVQCRFWYRFEVFRREPKNRYIATQLSNDRNVARQRLILL